MPHKGKNIRSQYDKNNLKQAVGAVQSGTMSVREAAQQFGIPRSTIYDRVSGRVSMDTSPGKQTVFPKEVENKLATNIKEAASMGIGLSKQQIIAKAARLAQSINLRTPFRNGVPGKDWAEGFLKRHPDISLRSQTPLSTVRSRMLNKVVTSNYFMELSNIVSRLNVKEKPEAIWNMDETSVSLCHRPTKVYAQKGARNIPGRVSNSRETLTVVACINAIGNEIPPLVIAKGKTPACLSSFNVSQGPPGTKYTFQGKGYMEDILGVQWFQSHFLQHCGTARPQLLILDSHSSHESYELLDLAKQNDIHLLALPPHTTHWLKPLDKTLFGPFQKEYNKVCTEFLSQSPNNNVCKWEWLRLFRLAHDKAFSRENIIKGFESCGIFPVDPKRIPTSAFAPSQPFDCASISEASSSISLPSGSSAGAVIQPSRDAAIQPSRSELEAPGPSLAPPVETVMTASGSLEGEIAAPRQDVEVLGTADDKGSLVLQGADAEDFIRAIAAGELLVSPVEECGATSICSQENNYLASQATGDDSLKTTSTSASNQDVTKIWCREIENVFKLPLPEVRQEKTNKRKLTSHRLLTSESIMNLKKQQKEEKERKEKIKEERKIARELKKVAKTKKELKKVTKTKNEQAKKE